MTAQPEDQGGLDLVVVGAGILGLAVARELMLRHPQLSLAVVEREADVAVHQTGHNSGVIHGGIYYQPGSLKARLCVEGARAMYEYLAEHRLPHERCGKLIVANRAEELGRLDELERRGAANGVPGLRRMTGSEIRDVEPEAAGIAALHAPNTGITDYAAVARCMRDELATAGVQLHFGTAVRHIADEGSWTVVEHERGRLRARRVVVCAGLWADRLARASGASADPRIVPFRGAYLRLVREGAPTVRGMIYPVPDPDLPFLGVHVTRHIDGHVMLGPTAMMVPARDGYRLNRWRARDLAESAAWPGSWRLARRFWRTGLTEVRMATSKKAFVAAAAAYVPGLTREHLDGTFHSGVRAQAVGRDGALVDDFVISQVGSVSHVRNAPSPAATAALAIGREIVDRISGVKEPG